MPMLRSLGRRAALGLFSLLAATLVASTAHAAPPAGADVPARTSVYTDDGLLGSVRLVPAIGVGAPDGMRFGVFAKWKGVIALGGAFSTLPETKLPGLGASVVRVGGEAFARVHPFQGAFFLGVAGGYAQTKGAMADQVEAFRQVQRVETRGYANAVYVAPHLGFQWMLPMGLTVGFDAGVEIPVVSHDPTFDAAKYGLVVPIEPTGSAADATHFVATMPVPVIHILELGYAL
jgi:hypothetical protein